MEQSSIAIWIFVGLIAFFAPTWLARPGRRLAIFIINAGIGWTGLGWLLALYKAAKSWEGVK